MSTFIGFCVAIGVVLIWFGICEPLILGLSARSKVVRFFLYIVGAWALLSLIKSFFRDK